MKTKQVQQREIKVKYNKFFDSGEKRKNQKNSKEKWGNGCGDVEVYIEEWWKNKRTRCKILRQVSAVREAGPAKSGSFHQLSREGEERVALAIS